MSGDDGFISRWSRRKAEARQRQGETAPEPRDEPAGGQAGETHAPSKAATQGLVSSGEAHSATAAEPAPPAVEPAPPAVEPAPTLEDVARLPPGAEIARFLSPSVDEGVKRAALKKLFADPHFNVMDGLDTYIDDYSKPDPIPLAMLRRLAQAQALGLVDEAPEAELDAARLGAGDHAAVEAPASGAAPAPLQAPDDASGRSPRPPTHGGPPKASTDGAAAAAVPQSADTSSSAVPPDEDTDLRLQQDHAAGRGRAGEGPGA